LTELPHSLYIHVPFCVSKCPYCDFNSHVGLEGLFDSYNRALVSEITSWGRELGRPRIDTIFIGGGTPSRVPSKHVGAILEAVRRSFEVAIGAEVTIEANPQSADGEKMEAWLAAGVNRLSLGFQSLDAAALAFLERAHSAAEAVGVFHCARRAGFTNINCDLIFAVPGLSTQRWVEVVQEVLALAPDHVSAYELTPERGTRLGADVASGRTAMPGEDLRLEQYEAAACLLAEAGFGRYEVSNWSLPGRQCRHNVAYWSGVPYAAAGAGAPAFVFAEAAPSWLRRARPAAAAAAVAAVAARQWNLAQPAAYITSVREKGHAMAGCEWLDIGTAIGDLVMMGLRRDAGIDMEAASRLYGVDLGAALATRVDWLARLGLLERAGDRVRATAQGTMVLNGVVAEFLG
jgi:oxygen-independent coproporphyrinogen III oxidase